MGQNMPGILELVIMKEINNPMKSEQKKEEIMKEFEKKFGWYLMPAQTNSDPAIAAKADFFISQSLDQYGEAVRKETMKDVNEDWNNHLNLGFNQEEIYEGINRNV